VRSDHFRLAIVVVVSPLLIGQTAAPAAPFIASISPSAGKANTSVTLTGSQFTADNTLVFGTLRVRHIGIESAVGIACTADANCRSGIVQTLKFKVPAKAVPGRTKVSVQNANGTSNAVAFTVLK
jgi:hypothetical protein